MITEILSDITNKDIEAQLKKHLQNISNLDQMDLALLITSGRIERYIKYFASILSYGGKNKLITIQNNDLYYYYLLGKKSNVQNSISLFNSARAYMKREMVAYFKTTSDKRRKKYMEVRHAFYIGFLSAIDKVTNEDFSNIYLSEIYKNKTDVPHMEKGFVAGFNFMKRK